MQDNSSQHQTEADLHSSYHSSYLSLLLFATWLPQDDYGVHMISTHALGAIWGVEQCSNLAKLPFLTVFFSFLHIWSTQHTHTALISSET